MTELEICPRCKKQKNSGGGAGGFVTQFIETCVCESLSNEQFETITVCARCNKRIPSRAGSITQWVFKDGNCACDRPEPVERAADGYTQPSFEGFDDESDEAVELPLDPEEFPVERYAPLVELGRGAAGVVYLCRDRTLRKKVAVKTLINLERSQLLSFQEEAKATARLNHPGIITVLDFGVTDGGTPFMVMEHVPGISLETYLKVKGAMEQEEACSIFLNLSQALEYAHRNGILHRDLKPSNIILKENAEGALEPLLIDFGIARVKEESGMLTEFQGKTLAGTPTYMAPDTINGESYDESSEVYSLGCVLFEALSGTPPFSGENALDVLARHARKEAPSLDLLVDRIDPDLAAIVARCLAKQKEDRFADMAEFARALSADTINDTTFKDTAASTSGAGNSMLLTLGVMTVLIFCGLAYTAYSTITDGKGRNAHKQSAAKKREREVEKNNRNKEYMLPYSALLDTDRHEAELVNRGRGNVLVTGQVKRYKENLTLLKGRRDISILEFTHDDLRGDTLEYIAELPLRKITLSYSNIDDGTMRIIARIPTLETLSISYSQVENSKLSELKGLKRLNNLGIWGHDLTEEFVEGLAELKQVTVLGICDCRSYPLSTFKLLSKNPNLLSLSAIGKGLPDECLKDLHLFKKLDTLELTKVPENLFDEVAKTNIRCMRISVNPDVTEDALMKASKVKTMKVYSIQSCDKINPDFATRFMKLRPDCKVTCQSATEVMMFSPDPNLQ